MNVPQDSSWVDTNVERIKGRSFEEVWRIREGTVKLVSDAANSPSMGTLPSHYRGYRFPPELISYAV